MKNITECFNESLSISQMLKSENINEGLKDIFKNVQAKFKKVFTYLKGIVVKFGSYFIPTDEAGDPMNAISPLTAGQAYKDGAINKESTLVCLNKEGSKIVGLGTNPESAKKLYGSGNSIKYWQRMIKECEENFETPINEVKMHTEDPEAKYNIIVDNEGLKRHIKLALTNKKLARLMIWGAPGIGKTAILMSVLDEYEDFKDYNLVVKTLSNETPDNFTLPKYVEVDGQEKAMDVPKTWLPVYKPTGDAAKDLELDKACGKGLLFVDELSRATPQVLNVVLPLVNEGIFNGYKLGSGWTIICASNRMEDEMSGQSDIGAALGNRFKHIYYEPCVKTWTSWAQKQNFISPLLTKWLEMPESENMSGGKFFYMDPNEDMESVAPTRLMCTPRSWTNAMRDLAEYSETGNLEGFTIFDIPTDILAMTLNSYVPASAVDSFIAFLEVIRNIGDFDAAVAGIWTKGSFKIDKKNLDLVKIPFSQLLCSAHGDTLPTTEEFANACTWITTQNNSSLCAYFLDVFKEVFAGVFTSNNDRDTVMALGEKIRVAKEGNAKKSPLSPDDYDDFIKTQTQLYAKFLSQWNISIEDTLKHNYMEGLRILGKKYGEVFKAAKFGDIDLLG